MEKEAEAWKMIDGRLLKIIALISMFIDHVGASLFPGIKAFRIIGRLAFPIYCFLLAEGAGHTHDLRRYILRMGIFALISEMPFDLALYHSVVYTGHQNVFFTLCIGLVMIYLIKHPFGMSGMPDQVTRLVIVAAAGSLAEVLRTDYGFSGIIIIFVFYILKENHVLQYLLVAIICISMNRIEAFAVLALIPIACYNGQRGRQTKTMQYGFYVFYPAHLVLLAMVYQFVLS